MNKTEALEAMRDGDKITHRYFGPKEWMTLDGNEILLEYGVRCTQAMFWQDRSSKEWEDGYDYFIGEEDILPETTFRKPFPLNGSRGMKGMYGQFAAMMALASMGGGDMGFGNGMSNNLTPDKIDININKVIPKGCKVYEFDGFSCVASSDKVANKKYQKFLNNETNQY